MSSLLKASTTPANPTVELSARICEVTYDTLPPSAIATAKYLIADGIAVAIAGSKETPPNLVAQYVRDLGCTPRASVMGFGFKTSPAFAAYANAVSMHVLDFEPMSSPPTHAVSPTVPTALALAETQQANGKEIIAACVKGFEMQGRFLIAANLERGALQFHSPGIVGLMGSAVAAAHLLKLNPLQLTHALGIGASRCSGISANTGSMVKCTHCGNAAMAGLEAALMAQRGFMAHPAILEAERGYVETFFPQHFDYDVLLEFGRPYRCVDPGMAIKFYPSKYPTQFAITAALDLRPAVGDVSNIKQIRILTAALEDANRPRPRSGLEGKFSLQYVVATALLDGKIGVGSFTDELRFRPAIVELLEKTTFVSDPALSRDTRKLRLEVEITLKDGTVHRQVCTKPPGFWGEPIDPDMHRAKIRDCLSVRLQDAQSQRILDLLSRLEQLSAKEVSDLMALLC